MGQNAPSLTAHLISILLLPFNVLVIIPLLLLLVFNSNIAWGLDWPMRLWVLLIGFGVIVLGLMIVSAAIREFAQKGRGTLAPWHPPRKLVISGVYRYTRNPMISGVVFVLLGQVILFGSIPLLIWFSLFATVNYLYFIFREEPHLEKTFGDDYRVYKQNVPRLIPRIKPWKK